MKTGEFVGPSHTTHGSYQRSNTFRHIKNTRKDSHNTTSKKTRDEILNLDFHVGLSEVRLFGFGIFLIEKGSGKPHHSMANQYTGGKWNVL
jgi:hypothetical protein